MTELPDAIRYLGFLGDIEETRMFRPLLAYTVKQIEHLSYPVACTPKIDGMRTLLDSARGPVTRNLKPITNEYARLKLAEAFEAFGGLNLDGEITASDPADRNAFLKTSSAIRRVKGEPEFVLSVFDCYSWPRLPFTERYARLREAFDRVSHPCVRLLEQVEVNSADELAMFETECLERGYEGVMVRSPDGIYKFGRSTERDGILGKIKRWEDFEAEIIGFEEQEANNNEAFYDERGYTKRTSHKENKVGKGTLGVLLGRRLDTGESIRVAHGVGLTHQLRQHIWDNQATFLGQAIAVKHQAHGQKDAPRIPVFKGFRDDLS
jgi:DNA ligase 1